MSTSADQSTDLPLEHRTAAAGPPIASTSQRFLTLLIDMFFFYAFAFIFGFVVAAVGLGGLLQATPGLLVGMFILLVYYVPQEIAGGQTIGKRIMKTRAVAEDGSSLTLGMTFGRTFCRFIPFEAFSFLGGSGQPQGWHDKISKTKVISLKQGG